MQPLPGARLGRRSAAGRRAASVIKKAPRLPPPVPSRPRRAQRPAWAKGTRFISTHTDSLGVPPQETRLRLVSSRQLIWVALGARTRGMQDEQAWHPAAKKGSR